MAISLQICPSMRLKNYGKGIRKNMRNWQKQALPPMSDRCLKCRKKVPSPSITGTTSGKLPRMKVLKMPSISLALSQPTFVHNFAKEKVPSAGLHSLVIRKIFIKPMKSFCGNLAIMNTFAIGFAWLEKKLPSKDCLPEFVGLAMANGPASAKLLTIWSHLEKLKHQLSLAVTI